MGPEVCEGGIPGDDAAEYYVRPPEGGPSLIITEGAYIDHLSPPKVVATCREQLGLGMPTLVRLSN